MTKVFNFVDRVFPVFLIVAAIVFCVITKERFFIATITISGVLCVMLAARGNIWNYIVGIYTTLTYAYVAYTNHLFGEMGLNLFFFLPTSILGFFLWKNKVVDNIVLMRRLTLNHRLLLFLTCILFTALTGFLLSLIPTQNTPYVDGLTNVLSIVATLLMMYRFQEQWFLYITLNMFTIFMWFLKMSSGSDEGSAMVAMWSLYLINSIYGAIKWHIGVKTNSKEAAV